MKVRFYEIGPKKKQWVSECDKPTLTPKFVLDQVKKMAMISGLLKVVINDDLATSQVVAANGNVIGGFCVGG